MTALSPELRDLIGKALREDIGTGDVTTRALILPSQKGKAVVTAKESGVLSGIKTAAEVFRFRDPSLKIKLHKKSGAGIKKGDKVLTVEGRITPILEAERTALNFLGHLSGISTLTRRYVDKIRGTQAKIFDTRKTTPLLRALEKYAVKSGGGKNHRFGLWDEILVKDNHWRVIASTPSPFPLPLKGERVGVRGKKRRKIPVEIEVRSLKQLARVLESPFVPDLILLDNFSVKELERAVNFVHGVRRTRPLLEASGGIHLDNVRAVAKTGVDRISVGRLTHSAPALDFSMEVTK